ncbi:TonB-dependent receptor [Parasegetibacter sp. NRK P23]|uniref:TonB-dependent receptor n=1 Tax=Parasegetibacter sp. NRK P23 TaxID=2942999 RepID=UPI002042E17A|nr:TonB-dependent receptor [Parasegetibacter sp. NRK P23]MCM5528583.1 TonB-dependent receptor [Parasegetibacter sp. NRK P23]
MKGTLLSVFLFLFTHQLSAQDKFTISGYVKDALSGETLIGATIAVNGSGRAVLANQYGFYSITLPAGEYELYVSFVGYEVLGKSIKLDADTRTDLLLTPRTAAANEVVVTARKRDNNLKDAQMGKISLSMNQVKSLPVLFGEVDILKTIQLLPGVRNAGEGNAGFYVRGGGPDQNLIMLDDAVVYNTGHLFGFFSIFNSDAIKNTSLIKGGMPPQYGGRLSSVLDVAMKDGNMNEWEARGGVGLIASRISVEGPIQKDKASFMLSARRTYIDALIKPFISKSSSFYGSGYYFYDLNTKLNYTFSDKDRLYLSGYFGRDVFTFRNRERAFNADIPWGNSTATIRWNHVFNPKLFSNTTVVYNDYKFSFGAAQQDFELKLSSGIRDVTTKADFDYFVSPKHKLKFGGLWTYHTFVPNVLSGSQGETTFNPNNSNTKYAHETGLYILDDWSVSDKLKLNAGLRWSGFAQTGPYKTFTTDADGNKLDSTVYNRGERVKMYQGIEPRLTVRYTLNAQSSLKFAVNRNQQFIHLVSNAGSTLPTDLWVPSTLRVKPQLSWQYAAGYFRNFSENTWETSVEVYFKDMQNQIEYREGYTPSLKDPEEEFTFGKGWSYGAEFYVNKAKGRLTGWVGYTLSWTWRKFPGLNDGLKFPAKYDRRHDLSVVGIYELSKKWKLSSVFVYGTGNATTLPERFYLVEGVLTQEYSKVNAYRLPAYHRLDLAATYSPAPRRPERRFRNEWVFSIYNVYSRLNPYFIYFDQTGSAYDGTLEVESLQVSLFPILPSVTWNFRF